MPSYRFCRSDDIPLLVRAYNECVRVHFPETPEMTVERFKHLIRAEDLWTSSCMVAFAGKQPIGCLLAAKRETENAILHIGILPEYRRQGHGRHLMTSLSAKMAILGPPRMLAEVPAAWTEARAFVEACGYRERRVYTDFIATGGKSRPEAAELVVPISFDDLVANDAIDLESHRCWARSPATLKNRKGEIRGLAVASSERIEAWVLFSIDKEGRRELLGVGGVASDRRETWLRLLCATLAADGPGCVHFARVDRDEVPADSLQSWGFLPGEQTLLLTADAVPG